MSEWLDARQCRADAWAAYMLTERGSGARREAAVVFAAACERLDALDNQLDSGLTPMV